MSGPVTRSKFAKSAMAAALNSPTVGASNTRSGNTARGMVLQPAGGLLSLPPEIRLEICSYITISPVYPDSVTNRGILMSCRQLEQDMFNEHKANELDVYINASERPWINNPRTTMSVTLGQPLASTRFIRSVTLHMSANFGRRRALDHLYSLYLDRLQILFDHTLRPDKSERSRYRARRLWRSSAGSDDEAGPSAHDADITQSKRDRIGPDLYLTVKSLPDSLFLDFVGAEKVNCRDVVFTVHQLATADGGRHKSTTIDMSDEAFSYTMTIVQDEEERQVEREFISETRFKRRAPQPIAG